MNKAELSKKAYLLHLSSIKLAEGMRSGSFRSLYRGQGIEFSGVREYLRGDDVRAIDWNVTARLGKPYVKMFEDERELDVFIIVDSSASMMTGNGRQSRLDTALDCASLLSLASLHNSSPVGAVIFDGDIQFSCVPKGGQNQSMLLLSQFSEKKYGNVPGSALDIALRGAGKLLRKRTLVLVFSDFRSAKWQESFAALCQKNDVVAVRITDPVDEKIPEIGSVTFADPETGSSTVLPTSSSAFIRAWRADNENKIEQWKKDCLRRGGVPFVISTDEDPAAALTRFFVQRERV